jgi:hypothetical protein
MMLKFAKWLVHALIIQLFLLSLSFPVLVAWGIAFSPLIFLGNVLFTPALTLFLALACVMYILELSGIPSDYIGVILDVVASGWLRAMSWAPDMPMVACPQAPLWVLVLMPLGAWAILRIYGLKNGFKTLCLLALWVFIVFFGIKYYFTPQDKELTVTCGARKSLLVSKNKKIYFVDSEYALQTRACSSSWIDYTLSSELVKNFGATTIDVIIVQKNTPATLQRLSALCKKYYCKKVYDMQGVKLQI